ncbi:MBL fold metallo-hydrolase (plasmid) [Natrinema zhouii]|uniref:MBL fold metallo-hydrolase n=1 Tax=Natrinema zhouii TaxID=1710539 RepID=UPI001D000E51|nr:MBL fold metallo-hydrolase [Natrinema zhouii]UHQ98759.1 MBL fold metallo-hydrolase [Natrinema zhouii]
MDLSFLHEVNPTHYEDTYYVDLDLYDIPSMGCAYILDADRPAVIETGVGKRYERILEALDEIGIKYEDVEVIAPTHVHLDHAGGAGFLARECPNATVRTYERGARHLVDPSRLVTGTKQAVGERWKFYVEPVPIDEDRVSGLEDGDVIDLGDRELEVHHAPGHAKHQAVYYDRQSDVVFAADAAGIYVPELDRIQPTTPPTQFDLEGALTDIDLLRDLDPDMLLYTHFGPRADVDRALSEYEELLKEWVDEIREKRAELTGDEAVIEHFPQRTDIVDLWGEENAVSEIRMNVRGVLGYLDRQ